IDSVVPHHAPEVESHEDLSVQVICLANKQGAAAGAPPDEPEQVQSVEVVLEQTFVEAVLDTPRLLAQLGERFFLRLAGANASVLTKGACQELLKVSKMDRHGDGYADARAAAINTAHRHIYTHHARQHGADLDLTDDELVQDEDKCEDAGDHTRPLGRAWRKVDVNGRVRVRMTRGTVMGPHAHNWEPFAGKGGDLAHEPESWKTPTGTMVHFNGRGGKWRGRKELLFCGPYCREVGLIKKGTGWLIVKTDGAADAFVALKPKMVLSIGHGANCSFILTSAMHKVYEYEDCKKRAVHIRGQDGKADIAEDENLQFPKATCDMCKKVAWAESFSVAGRASQDLCRSCWLETPDARRAAFVRHVFGKPTPEGHGKAMCGCSGCWPLPNGYSRMAEDELQEAPPQMPSPATKKPATGKKAK
ncbi:MAG: hypothetical protein ACOYMK_09415, partial [Hyphomonadaceae bacterium]